jgi:chromosome segregation protein
MFLDAFEGINSRFQKMFPKLFSGGKATLQLVDADNVLETGVDIIAQPPGKRLQNVNLLSGGEKALTAIALIFAIFQYKPSPFCLLDEVDAALDDVNIHRFNELIQEMAGTSQLVLITHNKQTMEIANTLFGVIMESPGVSKIVSVRMQ